MILFKSKYQAQRVHISLKCNLSYIFSMLVVWWMNATSAPVNRGRLTNTQLIPASARLFITVVKLLLMKRDFLFLKGKYVY